MLWCATSEHLMLTPRKSTGNMQLCFPWCGHCVSYDWPSPWPIDTPQSHRRFYSCYGDKFAPWTHHRKRRTLHSLLPSFLCSYKAASWLISYFGIFPSIIQMPFHCTHKLQEMHIDSGLDLSRLEAKEWGNHVSPCVVRREVAMQHLNSSIKRDYFTTLCKGLYSLTS